MRRLRNGWRVRKECRMVIVIVGGWMVAMVQMARGIVVYVVFAVVLVMVIVFVTPIGFDIDVISKVFGALMIQQGLFVRKYPRWKNRRVVIGMLVAIFAYPRRSLDDFVIFSMMTMMGVCFGQWLRFRRIRLVGCHGVLLPLPLCLRLRLRLRRRVLPFVVGPFPLPFRQRRTNLLAVRMTTPQVIFERSRLVERFVAVSTRMRGFVGGGGRGGTAPRLDFPREESHVITT
mmetsp:Transcript_25614/g.53034  ORF Transcript_25614/g.53034 Transcript_25614/m.53034 type:complete len:231 (+) Transcript_25614:493-1185(+)